MKFISGALKVAAAFIVCVMALGIVGPASIGAPLLALGGAVISLGVSGLFWFRRPSISGRIIAGVVALFAALYVNTYFDHRDGTAAIAQEEKIKEAKAKADADAAEKRRQEQERINAEAAARVEQEKREQAELQALRKSDPDQYLAKIKSIDEVKWLSELKELRPRQHAAYVEQQKKEEALRIAKIKEEAAQLEEQAQRARPLDYLTLDMHWQKGGFGSVMIATFIIKSTLKFPVKDITVRCTMEGNSGTEIARFDRTLYEIVPARSTKRIADVNLGFVPSQATRAGCQIRSVER